MSKRIKSVGFSLILILLVPMQTYALGNIVIQQLVPRPALEDPVIRLTFQATFLIGGLLWATGNGVVGFAVMGGSSIEENPFYSNAMALGASHEEAIALANIGRTSAKQQKSEIQTGLKLTVVVDSLRDAAPEFSTSPEFENYLQSLSLD